MSNLLLDAQEIVLINDEMPLFIPVNFSIYAGNRYYLTGINGAGKSSLLKAIHSTIIDEGVMKYSINKSSIGYLPHRVVVYDCLTLSEHIGLYAKMGVQPDYFSWCQSKLVSERLLNKKFIQMSQGERQRCGFLLTLCFSVRLLLLDEPFSHQDNEHKNAVNDVIEKLLSKSIAVIETTHQTQVHNNIVLEAVHA